MQNNVDKGATSSQRLHIDRKMVGILSVFAVLGLCLVISIVVATNTLSGLRAYSSLQTHWTEARKEATVQLVNYLRTRDNRYVSGFDSALVLIRKAGIVRNELLKPDTDNEIVRENLLAIHAEPADIDLMIKTFERFHDFQDFRRAVGAWRESDSLIALMEAEADQLQAAIHTGVFDDDREQRHAQTILALDSVLTEKQYELASALSSGTELLNGIILWVSISLGLILLLTGGSLSFRFLRSIKKWQRTIEISEQKYRSLFEQNPNAVYSLTTDGHFVSGNKALEKMTGFTIGELKGQRFNHFVEQAQLDKVKEYFKKAVGGTPMKYETVGVRKNGERTYVEITNLPIFVDGKIVGVYGIAQDITARKEAEQQLTEQLEEKTHLLSEVHDRVKNNLALISSLVHLQKETMDTGGAEKYLESTISRIQSMSMVHERLYHTNTFSSIRMDEYVKELSETVKESSKLKSDRFRLDITADPVTLSIKKAIPTGLLLNELLSNAFNHAFAGLENGNVAVELLQDGNEIILKVADNGIGLPDDVDPGSSQTLGMKLINVLSKQLGASLDFEKDDGTAFIVRFAGSQGLYKSA